MEELWEKIYNCSLNYGEFATIKSQASLNRFEISVKKFVERTNAISLQAEAGCYGSAYAYKFKFRKFNLLISGCKIQR
ncbi:MAG: hypothetical protein ACI37U_00385, partial [Bacteroides sp.]